MNKLSKHRVPVNIPNGYILNDRSYLSFIVPEDGINLYYDTISGWDFIGASPGFQLYQDDLLFNTASRRAQPTLNQLMYYRIPVTLEENEAYTFSLWCKKLFDDDASIQIYIGTADDDDTPTTFTQVWNVETSRVKSFWNPHEIKFTTTGYDDETYYYVVVKFLKAGEYLFDGFQLENKPYRTTYMTAKFLYTTEANNFAWQGTPYLSPTIRYGDYKNGRIINFSDIGMDLISAEGLGLPDFDHTLVDIPSASTQLYGGSVPNQRDITLDFVLYAYNVSNLFEQRLQLIRQLQTGKLHLYIQMLEGDEPISQTFEVTTLYDGGAELKLESLYGEKISLDLTTYDPYIYQVGYSGYTFSPVTSRTFYVPMLENGEWESVSYPLAGTSSLYKTTIVTDDGDVYLLKRYPALSEGYLFKYLGDNTWDTIAYNTSAGQGYHHMELVGDDIWILGGPHITMIKYNITSDTTDIKLIDTDGLAGYATLLPNNKLLVSGFFSEVDDPINSNTLNTNSIFFYNLDDDTIEEVITGGLNAGSVIYATEFFEGEIFAGGTFTNTSYDSQPIKNLIGIRGYAQPIGDRIKISYGEVEGNIFSMQIYNDKLYIGGEFLGTSKHASIDFTLENYLNALYPVSIGIVNRGLQRIDPFPVPTLLNFAEERVGLVYDMAVDDDNNLWAVGDFTWYGPYINDTTYSNQSLLDDFLDLGIVENENTSSIAVFNGVTWDTPTLFISESHIELDPDKAHIIYGVDAGGGKVAITNGGNGYASKNLFLTRELYEIPVQPNIYLATINDILFKHIDANGITLYLNKLVTDGEAYLLLLNNTPVESKSSLEGVKFNPLLFGSRSKAFYLNPGVNEIEFGVDLTLYAVFSTALFTVLWKNKYLSIDSIIKEDLI
jgi:hypothetical protein